MNERGKFIAFEGIKGSGKSTQAEQLRSHFAEDITNIVRVIDFPSTEKTPINYINKFDEQSESAHNNPIGLAYALDRISNKGIINEYMERNGIIIANPYLVSYLASQGATYSNKKERHAFYDRVLTTEFDYLGIPQPDKSIILDVSNETAKQNSDFKDNHKKLRPSQIENNHIETHASIQSRISDNYQELCQLHPELFTLIECTDKKGNRYSKQDIGNKVLSIINNKW